MAIDLVCDKCNRTTRVRDELAGKRVKCPGCSTPVTVPAAPARPAPEKRNPAEEGEEPRRPARQAREDEDEDEAPRRRAAVQDARPPARREEDEEDERPAKAARKGRRDEEEEEDERPRKKKPAASSLPMILGIGGGAVALLLIGLGVWWFFFTGNTPVADKSGDKGGDKNGKAGDKPSDFSALKEWVPGDSKGLVCVRPAELLRTAQVKKVLDEAKKWTGQADLFPPQFREVEAKLGVKLSDVERFTFVTHDIPILVAAGSRTADNPPLFWAVVELNVPVDQAKARAALGAVDVHIDGKKCLTGSLPGEKAYVHFVNDRFVVLGNDAGMRKAISLLGKRAAGDMDDALALAAKNRHFVLAVSTEVRELTEVKPKVRQDMQGNKELAKLLPLIEAKFTATSLHLGEKELELEASARFAGDAQAQAAKTAADDGGKLLKTLVGAARAFQPEAGKALDLADKALASVQISQEGPKLVVKARADVGPEATAVLLAAVEKMANADGGPSASQDRSNLSQIGKAFHNYVSANRNCFPAQAICDKGGKPLLSWRVTILPYIGEDALYKRFKLDEPWDSPHNKELIPLMPRLYAAPGHKSAGAGITHYQVFTGPNTPFVRPNDSLSVNAYADGLSNTFQVAEAGQGVVWTKPEDMAVAPGLLPKLGGQFDGYFHALFGDGSVRRIKVGTPEATLRAYISPSGAEVIND